MSQDQVLPPQLLADPVGQAGGGNAADTFSSSQVHSLQDQVATTCTVASLLISCYQIAMHLIHYNEPYIQLYILRILMMIPVYSMMTWLSIMIPTNALYFNTIRDIYEAYVLYIFMQLLIHFLGGENSLIVHLEFKRRIKQPWPLDGLKPLQTDKIFFRRVKQGVLQFVLIKPFTAILAIIFEHYGFLHEGHFEWYSGYMYLSAINNTSVSLSLYCLVLFYMATEERLKPFSPFAKFLCIKAILFFSFWQACAFTVLLKMNLFDRESANLAQNLIISVEMVFAAIAQSFAFNYRPFMEGARNFKKNNNTQIIQELQNVPSAALRATGNVIKNMSYVLNVKDVLTDAHSTFMGVHQEEEEEQRQVDDILRRDKAFNWSDEEIKTGSGSGSTSPSKEEPVIKNNDAQTRQRRTVASKTPQKPILQTQRPSRGSLGAVIQHQTTQAHFTSKSKETPVSHSNSSGRHSLPSKLGSHQAMVAPSQYQQVKTNSNTLSNTHKQLSQSNVLQETKTSQDFEYYDEEEEDEEEDEEVAEGQNYLDQNDSHTEEGDYDESIFQIAIDGGSNTTSNAAHRHHIKVASNIKEHQPTNKKQQQRGSQQSILQQV